MIRIVDYAAGNLTSVKRALDYMEIPSEITADSGKIRTAERIIFPGVGHAGTAMKILRERQLDTALKDAFSNVIPILGICLGTQIILSHSDEGDTTGLGLIDGNCPKFMFSDRTMKIPHMGWNAINIINKHPVLENVMSGNEFYFVHSYYPGPSKDINIFATCEYGISFPAVIGYNNLVATQFHPEKSGPTGLAILKNFSIWDGKLC